MNSFRVKTWKTLLSLALSAVLIGNGFSAVSAETSTDTDVIGETAGSAEEILSSMTLDEKISQMIIPAIRTWDEENVTKKGASHRELEEYSALRRHVDNLTHF